MAMRPEMAHWLMDRHTDFYLDYFDRMLAVAAGRIDILRTADGQTGRGFPPSAAHSRRSSVSTTQVAKRFFSPALNSAVMAAGSYSVPIQSRKGIPRASAASA